MNSKTNCKKNMETKTMGSTMNSETLVRIPLFILKWVAFCHTMLTSLLPDFFDIEIRWARIIGWRSRLVSCSRTGNVSAMNFGTSPLEHVKK